MPLFMFTMYCVHVTLLFTFLGKREIQIHLSIFGLTRVFGLKTKILI